MSSSRREKDEEKYNNEYRCGTIVSYIVILLSSHSTYRDSLKRWDVEAENVVIMRQTQVELTTKVRQVTWKLLEAHGGFIRYSKCATKSNHASACAHIWITCTLSCSMGSQSVCNFP